jgi:hypothetical protein
VTKIREPKPAIKKVYRSPKDRPVNERLISEITKGQKPTQTK